ncbi:unannotated protein [freshwater metagenome]|uniref:Unannotated protein n=1 Tax=freshwater metagenome TaxID=449393 RepID=A0A6J7L6N4_9ZZZZ
MARWVVIQAASMAVPRTPSVLNSARIPDPVRRVTRASGLPGADDVARCPSGSLPTRAQ